MTQKVWREAEGNGFDQNMICTAILGRIIVSRSISRAPAGAPRD